MKTVIVCLLLFSRTVVVLAQANEPYIVPHKGATISCPANKRMGWNNTSPVWQETGIDRADKLTKQGETAFRDGNLSIAEADFRDAIDQEKAWGNAYMGLAQVFTAQGQFAKAITFYRHVFYDLSLRGFDGPEKEEYRQKIYQNPVGATQYVSDGLRYALLLNQTGQWSEAVTVYNSALQGVPGGDLPKLDIPFDVSSPQPVAFEAMTRMALGLVLNFGADDDRNQYAMKQYAIALQLEPSWALTNYYYGYGWQHLSPVERAKFGTAQQAKAHLQKAVKIGSGAVKAAAQKALKNAG